MVEEALKKIRLEVAKMLIEEKSNTKNGKISLSVFVNSDLDFEYDDEFNEKMKKSLQKAMNGRNPKET